MKIYFVFKNILLYLCKQNNKIIIMNYFLKFKESLKERKSALEFQMKHQRGIIRCNYVVQVGNSTVGTNDENMIILNSTAGSTLPSQFDKQQVNEIRTKCKWNNVDGKMIPIKTFFYKDWYKNELEKVNDLLSTCESHKNKWEC